MKDQDARLVIYHLQEDLKEWKETVNSLIQRVAVLETFHSDGEIDNARYELLTQRH